MNNKVITNNGTIKLLSNVIILITITSIVANNVSYFVDIQTGNLGFFSTSAHTAIPRVVLQVFLLVDSI